MIYVTGNGKYLAAGNGELPAEGNSMRLTVEKLDAAAVRNPQLAQSRVNEFQYQSWTLSEVIFPVDTGSGLGWREIWTFNGPFMVEPSTNQLTVFFAPARSQLTYDAILEEVAA